jgi:hypothetical protein
MSAPDLKPYDVLSKDGQLTVTIRKEFDFGSLHQDWAHAILTLNPGPFEVVRIDMANCGLVSSTFFAGLMQLHFYYTGTGTRPLHLVKPDPRVVRNLGIMKMQTLFVIEGR